MTAALDSAYCFLSLFGFCLHKETWTSLNAFYTPFQKKKDELLSETLITIILSIGLLFFCLVPSTAPSRPHLQRGQHGLVSMGWAVSAPDTWKKTYSYPTTVLLVKAQMENKLYKNRGIGPYIACINYNVINC